MSDTGAVSPSSAVHGFISDAPGIVAELRKDASAFGAGEGDAAAALLRHFHDLATAADGHGLPRVAEIALRAEQLMGAEGISTEAATQTKIGELLGQIATEFDAAAEERGVPASGPVTPKFGWRALAIGREGPLLEAVRSTLASAGFAAQGVPDAATRSSRLSERPDLLVVVDDAAGDDVLARAAEFSGAGALRPRVIALVSPAERADRIRRLVAGVDIVIDAARVAVELPARVRALACMGSLPPRVLLAAGDGPAARTTVEWLAVLHAQVTHCSDGPSALAALACEPPDVILTDPHLPGLDGPSFARLVRQHAEFELTPIICLGTDGTVNAQIEAIRAGADYVLSAPLDRELLLNLVGERTARARRRRELVHRDGLTGLFNHPTLMTELEYSVEYARRHSETIAFMLVDVDHFRRINERYGHLVGDEVLRHLTREFQKAARGSDLLGRHGGEEFGFILRRTDRAGVRAFATKLRITLQANPAVLPTGEKIPVRISVGAASFPDDAACASDLALGAEAALRRAKTGGRDRAEFQPQLAVELH